MNCALLASGNWARVNSPEINSIRMLYMLQCIELNVLWLAQNDNIKLCMNIHCDYAILWRLWCCQFLALSCKHVFFTVSTVALASSPLKYRRLCAMATVSSNGSSPLLNPAWGFFVGLVLLFVCRCICVWRNITRRIVRCFWMVSGSCTHPLMYFNAFFTLTNSVRVITCCSNSVDGEKNYWPINLFTSYMHIYSTRPH